jgi:endonuclease I
MIKAYIFSLLLSVFSILAFGQGTETFTNIPANSGTYTTNNWTGDNTLPWSATDSRTDQVITGRAITIRNGSVFCNAIPNGITDLSFNHKQFFTGSNPVLQVYINGSLIGTANPTTTQATATFTNINVSGSFNLEIRQITAGLRIGIDDINWTSFGGTPCVEPTNQPTGLNLTPTINSVSGSFTAASPVVDGYLIVRSLSSSLTINPADGTTYITGQTLGNGTIVAAISSTAFTDNGLSSNTIYYYFVFAYNSISCTGAPNYLTVNPLTNSVTTLSPPACTTPAAPPTGLVLTPGPTTITGSFTAEPSANRYLVVYSQNNTLGFTPTNGTTYTAGQVIGADKIVSYGSTTTFTVTGLNSLTTYYVFVFAANGSCTGEPFYNTTSLDGSSTTTNSGIPAGYYDAAAGLNCGPLKTALRNIITTGQIALNYSTIDNVEMPVVDTIRSDDALRSIIWDVYSNNNAGPEPFEFNSSQNPSGGFCGGTTGGTEGVCWNKEHTFPRSWFKLSGSSYQQPTEADLFVVRATDSKINGNRGNIPYSTTGAPTYQFPTVGTFPGYPMPPNPVLDKIGPSNYAGVTAASAFEPSNAVKGDLARAYFYILTRYQNELSNWVSLNGATSISVVADGTTNGGLYPSFQLSYLKMMYAWNNLDPVDAKEINRNNLVFSQQNNRNPYIDHPEYVLAVWQCTGVLPVTVTDFTAQKNNESVLLKWYATFETNFKKYEIERSTDGIGYYKIGEVAGRNLANYSFTDNDLPNANTVFYRLKMIDIDGKFSNSKVVSVRIANNFSNAQVYPNPTKDKLVVKLQQALTENSQMLIADLSGRIVMQQQVTGGQRNIDLILNHLPPGRYFIKLSNSNELINQSFVIIK